jgi:hypothetical protein
MNLSKNQGLNRDGNFSLLLFDIIDVKRIGANRFTVDVSPGDRSLNNYCERYICTGF